MIGYYAHHHGSGHVTRATSIAAALDEPMTVLSSREAPSGTTIPWIGLPLDVDDENDHVDPTANGAVHWAPLSVDGLTQRMASIAEWVARMRPRLFVVDVSVEVAVFVRLLGIPVVVMAMPGDRGDAPHDVAYRMATRILAPWSDDAYEPDWLRAHREKTEYVGLISRFDSRSAEETGSAPGVVVLGGAGGTALTSADIEKAATSNPEFTWTAAGLDPASWVNDVWPLLCSASVVVTHGGQNALADLACARARTIVIPQDRPYGEQSASAEYLARAGAVVTRQTWPNPDEWPELLDAALQLDPRRWDITRQRGAAARAADVLSRMVTP